MESNIAGVLTATAGCAASAAITVGVAVADPAETGHALFASVIVAVVALMMGRQMADNDDDDDDGVREPTVGQDPTQRRIDEVLNMVRQGRITPADGERLIAKLQAHQLPADVPVPPYGTPGQGTP